MRPHRRQPTRLPLPWDSPGKNTGMGYHFLLQCMKVKSESEAAQSCLTLSDPMDCSLPGSSILGFSRQEYWSGVSLPSPTHILMMPKFYTFSPNLTLSTKYLFSVVLNTLLEYPVHMPSLTFLKKNPLCATHPILLSFPLTLMRSPLAHSMSQNCLR